MLVVAPERWDDACFAVPAVRALVGAGLSVGVLCAADRVDFWNRVDGIDVLDLQAQPDPGKWDAAIAWDYGPAAKAVKAARVQRRIAPDGEKRLGRWATHPVELRVHVLEHRVRHYLATVEALGVVTRDAAYFAAADAEGGCGQEAVLMCPDSDFGANHEWPLGRWVELGRVLREDRGMRLAVAKSGRGRGLGAELAERLGDGVATLDVTDLAGSLGAFAGGAYVVAADGSLPHVAGFAGATCVVLFGPNDSAWRRPLGKHHAVVCEHVECAPCFMAKCPLDLRCQERLGVARVAAAVVKTLDVARVG